MHILIEKSKRLLTLRDGERTVRTFSIALGKCPLGPKEKQGDQKTPEGKYHICLKKMGKYGPSLGISYPNVQDAQRMGADANLLSLIRAAEENRTRPPWGSPLGGEIYIHAGGTDSDWTAGCIALGDEDAQMLYDACGVGIDVVIIP